MPKFFAVSVILSLPSSPANSANGTLHEYRSASLKVFPLQAAPP